MVEVDNLTKRYGDMIAIDGVTFQAREGEILAFLGKNAAGKTTTMRIMTGFMPPTSGTVRINGHDILEDSLEARRQIGYLPETAPLYEDMSVRGYLRFCARLREVPPAEVDGRVETVMQSVNIHQRRDWQIGKLSKGLRRRVGLAQSLVHNPKVLILDEPTEGLDPEQIIEIRHLIRGLRGDHTVILSTHILPEAQMLADRIVIINSGRIVAVDTAENLTAAVQRAQRLRVQVAGPVRAVRERLQAIPAVQRVEVLDADEGRFIVESARETDIRERLAAEVIRAGWGLLELERLEPTLEDVFLQITARKAPTGAPREDGLRSSDRAEAVPEEVTEVATP
ncbi:MAG TPA: ATP-binding cassette domain-containing protein [Armatimonadota bacterium]|nr:ATP-binding cassette domain-containing protein [Armatimonadota bacterium]